MLQFNKARSGKTIASRDGFEALTKLAHRKNPPFAGILIDDTSRLGRNLSDVLPWVDRVLYNGVFLCFVAQDLHSDNPNFRMLLIGHGQHDENYITSLAQKTHRGQKNRIKNGRALARAYGYDLVPHYHPTKTVEYGQPQVEWVDYVVNPTLANVVIRIFTLYVGGHGTAKIAGLLNSEGVPSPLQAKGKGRRVWRTNTIKRKLSNKKYVGLNEWNKTKIVVDPDGVKHQKPRPQQEWITVEVPSLRIISDELWSQKELVCRQRSANGAGRRLGGRNRTEASEKYIFSGHLVCAMCGGAMVIHLGSELPEHLAALRKQKGLTQLLSSSSPRRSASTSCSFAAMRLGLLSPPSMSFGPWP
jgi:site-specific DNA recombinase